ncbi:putative carnitine operon oxidoreductase [Escherichia coli]|nr:putative carnitine operon oxidoreductase [Escherichia coli]
MLEINTSKIKNTVTFSVDKDSLKKAKDSITGLKEFADNIKPAKLRFDSVTKGYKKAQSEVDKIAGNDSNLLIVFYVQIMPDDLVMQLHRF